MWGIEWFSLRRDSLELVWYAGMRVVADVVSHDFGSVNRGTMVIGNCQVLRKEDLNERGGGWVLQGVFGVGEGGISLISTTTQISDTWPCTLHFTTSHRRQHMVVPRASRSLRKRDFLLIPVTATEEREG